MGTRQDKEPEHIYMRVCNEIDKAITDGDISRAQSMARRASLGQPRVLQNLDEPRQQEDQAA